VTFVAPAFLNFCLILNAPQARVHQNGCLRVVLAHLFDQVQPGKWIFYVIFSAAKIGNDQVEIGSLKVAKTIIGS
jgi:hypothetical protein